MKESRLLGARRLKDALDRHGIRPRKALGQNFVLDPNTIRKVLRAADVGSGDAVVEVGAGAGSLTLGLAAAAGRVVAVELDERLLPVLKETLADVENVEVVAADALRMEVSALDAAKMVGNLPYNIAVPLVLRFLTLAPQIEELAVMTQKEVGERLAAKPGSKVYGHTSVMVQYFGHAQVVAEVSRRAFYPVPNVDSVIVRIERHEPLADDTDRFLQVVRAGFAQRRKTLRNNLASIAGSAEAAATALSRAEIDDRARAEQVDVEGFVRLTREL